jgi:hypothetical protein
LAAVGIAGKCQIKESRFFMNGKVTFMVSVVLACAVIGTAVEVEWTGKGADDLWSTGDNWEGGKAPAASDVIVLSSPPERGPVINSDVTCGEIRGPAWRGDRQSVDVLAGANVSIGGWWRFAEKGDSVGTINVLGGNVTIIGVLRCSNGSSAHGIVNVVDGVIRADGMFLSDTGGGEMNVSGNSLVTFLNDLRFGGNRGRLPMTINMNGGIIRVGKALCCPAHSDRAGQASINLHGGTIECASFSHAEVQYSMDITEGELIIKGDVTADINKDIASGYITAFGGKDAVRCRYQSRSDKTIVTATNRKKVYRPSPRNRCENVKPDSKLTWRAGRGGGKKYNLYIGTSLDAVGDSAKAVKEGLTENSFGPVLGFEKTYHWRVDVIDEGGTLHKGTTWQFTTTDGKASDPNPASQAEKVASNATLTWKGGLVATSHRVFFGDDPARLVDKGIVARLVDKGIVSGNSFKPEGLEFAKQYYWRVDAINGSWKQSPWKGKLWSFTVDPGKATNPKPIDLAQWKPTKMTLSWKAARAATAHTVYISDKLEDVENGTKAASKAQKQTAYTLELKEATTYYWRVDQVIGDKVVKGDIWKFSTVGMLDLKVDLAVPQWYDRMKARPGTVKPGWYPLFHPGWADMYMHDGVWLPVGKTTPDPEGILGTGIQLYIDNGKGGNGAITAYGLCRGGLAGDLPVFGEPVGDPIANSYFYSCDWAGQKNGDGFLLIRGLPAGEYEMTSYHNHWEPSQQQTRNCHDHVSGMPPMPSVTANPVPTEALPGYGSWALPKGTGKGVVSLLEAKNVKVSSVLSDDEVTTSLIKFSTDGSDVLIIYEAADNTYPDRARSGFQGHMECI